MRLRLGGDSGSLWFAHTVEVFQLHQHARVLSQGVGMSVQVVPVQGGERASRFASGLGRVVSTAFAMVAHAVDVLAAGDIGFAGHEAAIRVLAHAQSVGKLHPFDRVHIHGQIPFVHLLRLYAQ